ncbi:hypothetical protein HJC23_013103 [Cyclotella cryptica]|uniref:ELMO domain-containing protein n=1 Tax=Cyclotella cryptica TaxID=29204 RepID=A0ABD3PGT4_9STRA|eukprot:CCRYP_014770-RA/>CCRYP_014770-RA protein AED:0.05 eAED:0.05 QI:79/1/0.75/1/1/1/4/33/723
MRLTREHKKQTETRASKDPVKEGTMINVPDLLVDGSSVPPPSQGNNTSDPKNFDTGASDNIATALFASPSTSKNGSNTSKDNVPPPPPSQRGWGSIVGGMAGSLVYSARDAVTSYNSRTGSIAENVTNAAASFSTNIGNVNLQPLQSLTKSISNNITGKNTLPDKTTASQVLMFRQLLHTSCRPGLRLSRGYEGTPAQRAVLHMPWWERGEVLIQGGPSAVSFDPMRLIRNLYPRFRNRTVQENGHILVSGIQSDRDIIRNVSFFAVLTLAFLFARLTLDSDNLITRLWLSGAIMPYEKGGYAATSTYPADSPLQNDLGSVDTLINDRGLPPIPHQYWIDRLGFQQDDPVTDFRSGGVLSLAMLVHIVESCPTVHARFVPKTLEGNFTSSNTDPAVMNLEQIIMEDASVLPFGITCINITDMLAKFLMFSKAVDKMDALLSAKPFWKMFIDPNAMLVLQEVSLDLLCDVCVEIGRERRLAQLSACGSDNGTKKGEKTFGTLGTKVTVFDFSEIMDRTEKRVGEEILGVGPQNVDELRAIARRVKSKYLMRIQLKEKHLAKPSPPLKQLPPISLTLPRKQSIKNVTNSAMGGVGGFVNLWNSSSIAVSEETETHHANVNNIAPSEEGPTLNGGEEVEIQYIEGDICTAIDNPIGTSPEPAQLDSAANRAVDQSVTSEAFDLLGGDFSPVSAGHIDQSDQEILDSIGMKFDPAAAFTIDDDDFML